MLLTRAPLYRGLPPFSCDLHVLGAPLTFALSQDQTLQLMSDPKAEAFRPDDTIRADSQDSFLACVIAQVTLSVMSSDLRQSPCGRTASSTETLSSA